MAKKIYATIASSGSNTKSIIDSKLYFEKYREQNNIRVDAIIFVYLDEEDTVKYMLDLLGDGGTLFVSNARYITDELKQSIKAKGTTIVLI